MIRRRAFLINQFNIKNNNINLIHKNVILSNLYFIFKSNNFLNKRIFFKKFNHKYKIHKYFFILKKFSNNIVLIKKLFTEFLNLIFYNYNFYLYNIIFKHLSNKVILFNFKSSPIIYNYTKIKLLYNKLTLLNNLSLSVYINYCINLYKLNIFLTKLICI